MKTMPFQEFKELIEKSDYNKWTKEDMYDMMNNHPEYADWSREELEQIVRELDLEAEGYFERASSLQCEASTLTDLITLMYGE